MDNGKKSGRPPLNLSLLPWHLAIVRLSPDAAIPDWVGGTFYAVTRTADELSIVVDETRVPAGVPCAGGWRAMRVLGTLDFSEVGILASLSGALAEARVSLFALSTFDTDYILVQATDLDKACSSLEEAGASVDLGR